MALRSNPRITIETRRRVEAAASRLGYVPNARLGELMTELRMTRDRSYTGTLALMGLYRDPLPWNHVAHLRRIATSARQTAQRLGYVIEDFAMEGAGISPKRLRSILEARRIRGIFCIGVENAGKELPGALSDFTIVTQGVSLLGRFNRVLSHFGADCNLVLRELLARGYSRPALTIEPEGDERTNFEYSNTFLGMCERIFLADHIPILRSAPFSPQGFGQWFDRYRPDVLVVHQAPEFTTEMVRFLAGRDIHIPRSLGLALLDMTPDPDHFSGIRQDFEQIGQSAVEMLIEQVALAPLMLQRAPKIELVEGTWHEGRTLRPRRTKVQSP